MFLRTWALGAAFWSVSLPSASAIAAPAEQTSDAGPERTAPKSTTGPWVGEFELGLGWYFLPLSDICTTATCKRGDTSPLFHLNALLHPHRRWAFGAGAAFALLPTTVPHLDSNAENADRSLARAYMEFDVMARFYPWRQFAGEDGTLDLWLGPTLGLIVLSDRYRSPSVDQTGPLRIGSPGITLASPALAARATLGLDYGLSKLFFLGAQVSPGLAAFAKNPKETPFGDIATVSGAEFTLAATLAIKLLVDL